jgi:hypothetical protein
VFVNDPRDWVGSDCEARKCASDRTSGRIPMPCLLVNHGLSDENVVDFRYEHGRITFGEKNHVSAMFLAPGGLTFDSYSRTISLRVCVLTVYSERARAGPPSGCRRRFSSHPLWFPARSAPALPCVVRVSTPVCQRSQSRETLFPLSGSPPQVREPLFVRKVRVAVRSSGPKHG